MNWRSRKAIGLIVAGIVTASGGAVYLIDPVTSLVCAVVGCHG